MQVQGPKARVGPHAAPLYAWSRKQADDSDGADQAMRPPIYLDEEGSMPESL